MIRILCLVILLSFVTKLSCQVNLFFESRVEIVSQGFKRMNSANPHFVHSKNLPTFSHQYDELSSSLKIRNNQHGDTILESSPYKSWGSFPLSISFGTQNCLWKKGRFSINYHIGALYSFHKANRFILNRTHYTKDLDSVLLDTASQYYIINTFDSVNEIRAYENIRRIGVIYGIDLSYQITKRFGFGIMLRGINSIQVTNNLWVKENTKTYTDQRTSDDFYLDDYVGCGVVRFLGWSCYGPPKLYAYNSFKKSDYVKVRQKRRHQFNLDINLRPSIKLGSSKQTELYGLLGVSALVSQGSEYMNNNYMNSFNYGLGCVFNLISI